MSASPTDQTPDDAVEAAYRAGLQLDHLNPPDIVAFMRGVLRRAGHAIPEEEEELEPFTELVREMADRLDLLVDRLMAAGFPIDTHIEIDPGEHGEGLDGEAATQWRRLEAALTESARRLAGIPLSGWGSDAELVATTRSAVGDVGWALRRLEAEAEDEQE